MQHPWATNAATRLQEFIYRKPEHINDIEMLVEAARRLKNDPYNLWTSRDSTGEWHCVIGPSVVAPNYLLGMSYLIRDDWHQVDVISFYGWLAC